MPAAPFSGSRSQRLPDDYTAPTEDTPEALNLDGDDDEALGAENRVARALPGAGFFTAVQRFYGQYWVSRGTASGSEFAWGMLWALGSAGACCALTLWMGGVVTGGGDSVSSLFRVLYMLMVYLCPAWLIVHLGPTFSLIRRFVNGARDRAPGASVSPGR